jgi:hypothetical protein
MLLPKNHLAEIIVKNSSPVATATNTSWLFRSSLLSKAFSMKGERQSTDLISSYRNNFNVSCSHH